MDIGSISLLVSIAVGAVQLLKHIQGKELDVAKELDYIKKDIIEIKIQNGICLTDRHNQNEDIKNQVRVVEKIFDKLNDM